jgi:class 3 adenylate cyclase/pimeloyl-ACP methyl ester carboxylesterase
MEPEIRYTTTSDGVTIAYHEWGEGPTIAVLSPGLWYSFEADLRGERQALAYELVRRTVRQIRFDPRGCGHSDRDVDDFSLEAMLRDLAAVADATDSDSLALVAIGNSAPVAIAYAALYPERVTHLVLVSSILPSMEPEAIRRLDDLINVDWRLVTETLARIVAAWNDDERAIEVANDVRAAVSPEAFERYRRCFQGWDVERHYEHVQAPALILQPRNHPYWPEATARRIASKIGGARIVMVDPADLYPVGPKALAIIGEFLGVGRPRGEPPLPEGAVVIMFTDIADSTALTERMGDRAFRAAAGSLDEGLRRVIREAGGRTVEGKLLGDGVLAVFRSAHSAIDAALACRALSDESELGLHIGLHAGDVQREGTNIYGGAVNIAARVCALSRPGEILVSGTVRDLGRTSADVAFEPRGAHDLKGVADPVPVYAIQAGLRD